MPAPPFAVYHLPGGAVVLAAEDAFGQFCPSRTVLIGPGILLTQLTWRRYSMAARPVS